MKSALLLGLVLFALGFLPLMGGPRYEAALMCGLIGPSWLAVASALAAVKRVRTLRLGARDDGTRRQLLGSEVVGHAMALGVGHVLVVLAVALAHGIREGFCEPASGFLLFLLGPGAGMVTAALIGSLSGVTVSLIPRGGPRFFAAVTACLIALFFPVGSILGGVLHFYLSPAVFAYDPFVGYFSGPLYDTVSYDLTRLLTYRVGTALTWLSLSAFLSQIAFRFSGADNRGAYFLPRTGQRVLWLVLAGLSFLGAFFHAALAEDMRLESSAVSIQRGLGRMVESGRCRVFFSGGVDSRVARRSAHECVGHLAQLEKYFEVSAGGRVDVYLFASAEEKRLFMGASRTYIAKPWRREVYLQPSSFPHQVLGHELAHVVTGEFGAGPMKIAGLFGGLMPDPGRIEGFAEAASPREDSEGTLHQWTSAMKELGLLPPLKSLFQLSFLGSSAARSYAASGSFVDYVRGKYGASVLRSWYRSGDLPGLTGRSFSELEEDWHQFLEATVVPEQVLEIARPRFSRPGIFERRCPHAVDRAVGDAHTYCPLQEEKAQSFAEHAISLDPTKVDLELSMARCAWFSGDPARAQKQLAFGAGQDKRYEPGARRGAWEFAGDIAWQEGKPDEAKKLYESARALTFDKDGLRQLDVKQWALAQAEDVQHPLRILLAPRYQEEVMTTVALAEWAEKGPHTDLAVYLLARLAERDGAFQHSGQLLSELEVDSLPLDSLKREAARMKFLHACEERMRGGVAKDFKLASLAYRSETLSPAETLEAQRLTERCETVGLRSDETSKSLSP